ncbi:flagellar biosynthesis protein FliQ [Magnetospira sp. QH-2]|uniref:flagellar biosynthesis protein FliQ n=1 Tax=Magnetospira sp. (strain QH-2) TaxID=1288970 RepID=UPI0003E81087|nr:flagellar biosynthesis protein FliQ [Magnetospira sp. QH-2]CCQ74106.1 Flagellar biosynthetic protein fliQ [Magnetospira sp. QH-2]
MTQTAVLELGRDSMYVIFKLALPIMLAGMGIGLVIALFQALTSLQEMTLTFVPKIVVIFAALVMFLPFMMTTMIEFGNKIFDIIISL